MTERLNDQEQEYRKTSTIRASQWWQMGDHPAVILKSDPNRYADEGVPWCPTLEGGHVVTPGDWIATGVHGEHWPIKPDVFAKTYELALPLAHPTPVGDRWNDALEAIAQGMAVSRDQDEAEAYSHCGTSDWDGSPSDYIADCRAEIRTILDAALTPTSLRSVEEPLAAREERVMQQWKFGNLTPLGVANALMKEGFNSTYAAGKANYLRSLNPHPQSVGSEASTRIAELEATIAMYREGTLAAFDALCPKCKGSAKVSDQTRATLIGKPPTLTGGA